MLGQMETNQAHIFKGFLLGKLGKIQMPVLLLRELRLKLDCSRICHQVSQRMELTHRGQRRALTRD